MTRLIGASGYSREDWIGPFHPEGARPGGMLARYAAHFDAAESIFAYWESLKIGGPKYLRDSKDIFVAKNKEYTGIQVAMKMGIKRIAIENTPAFKGKLFNILNDACYTDTAYAGLPRKPREPYFHVSKTGERTRLFVWLLRNLPFTREEYESAKDSDFARHIPLAGKRSNFQGYQERFPFRPPRTLDG